MTSSREKFEEWVKDNLHPSASNAVIRIAWSAWQASRQCIEVELPEWFVDKVNAVYDRDEVEQAIESAGIKIKGA